MLPISVCMIVKNEEKRIERCLKSLQPYGFELVVVDTGSTDNTKNIVSKYTDSLYDFQWVEDFSAARNFSLKKAKNDWIFMIDSDEWIESIDLEELEYFRKHLSLAVGSVTRRNLTGNPEHPGETTDQTERFFNRKRYHYTGRIHEQLTPKYGKNFEAFLLNTSIGHDGYLMTEIERKEKAYRNIHLLEKELKENPENPYLYYQLGKGYDIIDDYEHSTIYYKKALQYDLDYDLAYVQALIIAYGEALFYQNDYQKAMVLKKFHRALSQNADYLYIMGRIYMENQLFEDALNCFETATQLTDCKKTGTNSYLSFYEIGKILMMISEWDLAKNYFEQCGEYNPAKQAIQAINAKINE